MLSAKSGRAALRDRWLWGVLAIALFWRLVPLIWYTADCVRDECIYRSMAGFIADGGGMRETARGWLPAPGYPYLLAIPKFLFGVAQPIKAFQVVVSLLSTVQIYLLGTHVLDRRTGRVAALLFAINPTIAWFTHTMWIETVYTFLLLAAVMLVFEVRERTSLWWAAALGVTMGIAVLFRGVATYLPPIFLLALVWPADDDVSSLPSVSAWAEALKAKLRPIAVYVLAWGLTIAPYSLTASNIHGGFMLTDATTGHVLWLGNNDFQPITFDYGNGMLNEGIFTRTIRTGRRPCERELLPVESSRCEVERVREWVADHPGEFARRVPKRIAQFFNPNSFLTRHVRWGRFVGLPWLMKEALCLWIVLTTLSLTLGGTLAAWGRGRGPYLIMAVGTAAYTVGVTALMYGMTRFRLPLEAMWCVYLAILIVRPRETWRELLASPVRLTGALLTLPSLFALSLWYLPTGFPMFWR
ncbi:MAG: glycosyltransferase family 39 protein [Myxococcota bacterium]